MANAGLERVDTLLSELSLDEKISLLAGQDFWTLPAIPRLGIPSLRMSDGPTGLRSTNSEPSTVFPVGVALAATWNPSLVQDVAAAIGREAIAHEVDVLLAPGVNIQRTPLGGRNFEYYSEDPHLSAEIGIAYVNGVQGQGVGTSVKHFVANNQEHERLRASSNISERALREIYLASFEAIVKRAQPWTIMSAYNRVNGTFASEHDCLLNQILREEWGFDGVVVSDWGAAKSTAESALGGLDVEMPGPAIHYGAALKEAVEAGDVPEEVVDAHARRVLVLLARCGLLGNAPGKAVGALRTAEHRALARKAAAESIILLKNEGTLLPLNGAESISVIGAGADYPAIQGGGSSQVTPDRIVTPFEGLTEALESHAELWFARGIDHEPRPPIIDGRLLSPTPDGLEPGLNVRYFSQADYSGDIVHEGVEWRFAKMGFGEEAQTEDSIAFSAEWTGYFTPQYSGPHEFVITHANADAELHLDGEILIGDHSALEIEMLFMVLPLNRRSATVQLEAGRAYPITIRYSQSDENAIRGFNINNVYLRQPAPDRAEALACATKSDVAIVFVGAGTTAETEGEDRASMRLSDAQNQLVEDVLAVNENTIVVVNSGAPVEMPWADKVPVIVLMWLPGQECGHALADVLTGKTSPSGKLPVSFPLKYEDNPTFLHYPGGLQTEYGEGVFVGYRYYDAMAIEPLFPFGHGLTFSQFEVTDLACPEVISVRDSLQLNISLTNSGRMEAAETLQVYVQDKATAEAMPVRQLRAFQKVHLLPGETRRLTFKLPERAFAWFDPDKMDWCVTPGEYVVSIGTSSRDLHASARVRIEAL